MSKMPSHHGVIENSQKEKTYPDETIKLLLERASCRNFQDREIPEEVLDYILRAGVHTPSGGNLQPYSIIKIEDPDNRKRLGELCSQPFIGKAPVNLIFCIDWRRIKRWADLEVAPFTAHCSFRHFWISFQDTIIAAQNICTAADAMGLGSVYIGTIIEFFPEVKEMFSLPDLVLPVVLLCIGYPVKRPGIRKKLPVNAIVHNEKYHEMKDDELLKVFTGKYLEKRVEISEKRLRKIEHVCKEVSGEEFANKCIEKIKEQGYINPAQHYFGLHYMANEMPGGNEEYLKTIEKFGFNWFREYKL
ncbi:MAG: nitroreductase family protein [Candidatus Eremiobacteraeota bacterium]|nr:nitroreductase family protein [Candidatus Eremiobacteraeota bacterium]